MIKLLLLIEKYQEKHADLLSDYQRNGKTMSPLELNEARSRMADILEIIKDLKKL